MTLLRGAHPNAHHVQGLVVGEGLQASGGLHAVPDVGAGARHAVLRPRHRVC